MILKQNDDGVTWSAMKRVIVADPANKVEAARQAYVGPGRYAAVDWDIRTEFDMTPGAVKVTPR